MIINFFVQLSEKGNLYSWGRGDFGQLGRPCSNKFDPVPGKIAVKPVTTHTSGSEHNLAITGQYHSTHFFIIDSFCPNN